MRACRHVSSHSRSESLAISTVSRTLPVLTRVQRAIQALWEVVQKKQSRGGFARGAQSSIDLADIKSLVDAISSLLEVFQVSSKQILLYWFRSDRHPQFESSIAVEKRLGLLIEHLKRPEKVMKAIKSGKSFLIENQSEAHVLSAGRQLRIRGDRLRAAQRRRVHGGHPSRCAL